MRPLELLHCSCSVVLHDKEEIRNTVYCYHTWQCVENNGSPIVYMYVYGSNDYIHTYNYYGMLGYKVGSDIHVTTEFESIHTYVCIHTQLVLIRTHNEVCVFPHKNDSTTQNQNPFPCISGS